MSIYADHASLKPLLPQVKEQIRNFVDCDFCNPSAIYSTGRITRRLIEQAREKVAAAIGADIDEIYFTSGSTEAINWLFRSTTNHIITSNIEHKAFMRQKETYQGCIFDISVDSRGVVDVDNIKNLCDYYGNDVTVALGWVNNEIGTIQPIEEIADICKQAGSKLFIDATQAIGNIPINVHKMNIDYLCGSGQKLGALGGCGFIYVCKGIDLAPIQLGGAQERGMRAGTENALGIIALATAMNIVTKNVEEKALQTANQRDKIISGLLEIPNSHLNGTLGNRVCNNINVSFDGIEGESLVLQLDTCGIQCSTGSACNSQSIEPSYVLKAIGLDDDTARAAIRITIGDDITDLEVNYLIKTVKKCVELLRGMSPKWKEISNGHN